MCTAHILHLVKNIQFTICTKLKVWHISKLLLERPRGARCWKWVIWTGGMVIDVFQGAATSVLNLFRALTCPSHLNHLLSLISLSSLWILNVSCQSQPRLASKIWKGMLLNNCSATCHQARMIIKMPPTSSSLQWLLRRLWWADQEISMVSHNVLSEAGLQS